MANDERENEGQESQRRRGLEGKGFDAGTGYGGAGSDSAHARESGYGGQSSGAGSGASIPRGTDEHSDEPDREEGSVGAPRAADRDPTGVDLDAPLGGERRDPGR